MSSDNKQADKWLFKIKEKVNLVREDASPSEFGEIMRQMQNRTAKKRQIKYIIYSVSSVAAIMLFALFIPLKNNIISNTKEIKEEIIANDVKPEIKEVNNKSTIKEFKKIKTIKKKSEVLSLALNEDNSASQIANNDTIANNLNYEITKDTSRNLQSELITDQLLAINTTKEPKYKNKKNSNYNSYSLGLNIGNSGTTNDNTNTFSKSSMNNGNTPSDDIIVTTEPVNINYKEAPLEGKYTHHQPWRIGVSTGLKLKHNINIETGIIYSFLGADIQATQRYKVKQSLHYIGIPIKFNWEFVGNNKFGVYVGASFTVNKCISAKVGDEKIKIKKFEPTTDIFAGAMYKITPILGIYFEPGVNYYLGKEQIGTTKNGFKIKNSYSDNKVGLTLEAGFKFSF